MMQNEMLYELALSSGKPITDNRNSPEENHVSSTSYRILSHLKFLPTKDSTGLRRQSFLLASPHHLLLRVFYSIWNPLTQHIMLESRSPTMLAVKIHHSQNFLQPSFPLSSILLKNDLKLFTVFSHNSIKSLLSRTITVIKSQNHCGSTIVSPTLLGLEQTPRRTLLF